MNEHERINLDKAWALLVDSNALTLDLLGGVLEGFGMRNLVRVSSAEEAMEKCRQHVFDLIFTESTMPDLDGYDFVRWIRNESDEQLKLTPVIVITAHTRRKHVIRARDCGANYIIAKPITPKIILERIVWVANSKRVFIETDDFIGPDRRFHKVDPPEEFGVGRRREDRNKQDSVSDPSNEPDNNDPVSETTTA